MDWETQNILVTSPKFGPLASTIWDVWLCLDLGLTKYMIKAESISG